MLCASLKGPDSNRIQIVTDESPQDGHQGSADSSTHKRVENRDEIKSWKTASETCAPQAYRRNADLTNYIQEPPTLSLGI